MPMGAVPSCLISTIQTADSPLMSGVVIAQAPRPPGNVHKGLYPEGYTSNWIDVVLLGTKFELTETLHMTRYGDRCSGMNDADTQRSPRQIQTRIVGGIHGNLNRQSSGTTHRLENSISLGMCLIRHTSHDEDRPLTTPIQSSLSKQGRKNVMTITAC